MFVKTLLVLSLAAAALGGVQRSRLHQYPTGGKIVGGEAAGDGEIPWQISIQTTSNSQSCGGSIISDEWIVTAAHCSLTVAGYQVRAGTLTYASGGSVHEITNVTRHEDFNFFTLLNDISVWHINPPFIWDANTAPVTLPQQGVETPESTMITVSGWGTTSSGGQVSPDLLKVDIPIVSKADCDTAYGGIPPNQICAGIPDGGIDSCQGDSGGPLYLTGTQELRGIVSWGNGCALPGYPGVYTEVSAYRDWITTHSGV